jgi:hypothetical protein
MGSVTEAIEKQGAVNCTWKAGEIEAYKEIKVTEIEATKAWKAEEIAVQKAQLALQKRRAVAEVKVLSEKAAQRNAEH